MRSCLKQMLPVVMRPVLNIIEIYVEILLNHINQTYTLYNF